MSRDAWGFLNRAPLQLLLTGPRLVARSTPGVGWREDRSTMLGLAARNFISHRVLERRRKQSESHSGRVPGLPVAV